MKLRIKGNTLRMRLSEPEVNMLAEGKSVVDKTEFPSADLVYKIEPWEGNSADFEEGMLRIGLNKDEINVWAETDQVSISMESTSKSGNILSILVEKDFKCLTVRPEDESEMYPNPNKHHC
ncbi:MAG: hypothetical protein DRI71_09375 [Bacteroidetes bacterium]|nr:MAG: hypothetical protein DRI71_09375 [Bacteroidota bacterium]